MSTRHKPFSKLLAWALTIALMLTLAPMFTFVAYADGELGPQTISITAPVAGATPQSTIADGTGWTVNDITWFDVDTLLPQTGPFAAASAYIASVTLQSTSGYEWPDPPPTITVAGGTVSDYVVSGTGTGNYLSFSVTFPATAGGSSGGTNYGDYTGGGGGTTPSTPPGDGGTTDLPGGGAVETPPGQDPVQNDDGSTSLPGGGSITTPGGSEVDAPPGTVIDEDGTIFFPPDSGGTITAPGGGGGTGGGVTIDVPPGTVKEPDGKISFPPGSGGGTITHGSGHSFDIHEDTVIILDMEVPLGYFVSIDSPFADVSDAGWFHGAVMFAYSHGLMTGTDPMQFAPNSPTTRGMIVTVLYRKAGSPGAGRDAPGASFTDVAANTWYTDSINWAAENGIVGGYGGGLFGPNDNITRQDLAVILLNYAKSAGLRLPVLRGYAGFGDAEDISGYAAEAVELLYRAGVISGRPGDVFDPLGLATRAELATMLMNFLHAVDQA